MVARRTTAAALVALTLGLGTGQAAAPRKVRVPNVVGNLKASAETRLRAVKLRPRAVYVKSLKLVGTVVAETPRAGAKVVVGTRVTISVSSGPGP